MKINEVPQDQGFLIEGKVRDVCYAVDENGHYTKALSKGWEPKNEAMKMAWDVIFERVNDVRTKVLAGEFSPIAFYMELNVMDVAILSDYTSISKFKGEKAPENEKFKELTTEVLEKYASAFNISVEELKDVVKIKEIDRL